MTREHTVRSLNDVKCPHCDHKHHKEAEDMAWNDGDSTEFKCNSCDKPFICEAWVSTNWTAKELES